MFVVEQLWKSDKYEEVYLHAYDAVAAAKAGSESILPFITVDVLTQRLTATHPTTFTSNLSPSWWLHNRWSSTYPDREIRLGKRDHLYEQRFMNEHRIRQIFFISVLLKGADALIEGVSGFVLAFFSTSAIIRLVNTLTQEELIEDPHDFIATHLLSLAQKLTVSTKHFYALYLLGHGVIKVFLVIGLLRNRLWAYPVSLAVLGLFIIYQICRFSYTHSLGLLVLTGFDLMVMGLVWHEYRLIRRHAALR